MLKTLAEKKALEEKKEEVDESMINTAKCEKKPEDKEKDMRGTYAKINLIRNKLRSMGQKDPMVMMAMSPTKGQKLNMYGEEKVDGSKERTAADPGAPARMGRTEGSQVQQKITPRRKGTTIIKGQKYNPRYNPFTKDGKTRPGDKTPTSASETTGP